MNPKIDIHVLAARYLSGEMNKRQKRKFLSTLEKQEENKIEFQKISRDWETMFPQSEEVKKDTNEAWNKLIFRLNNDGLVESSGNSVRLISPYVWRLAASILLLVAISIPSILYFTSKQGTFGSHSLEATEQTTSYDLPDGSRIFLKRGSAIVLAKNFESDRKLNLKGEAYFDVMADPAHPFQVTTGEALISVLGTEFNIKENKGAGQTEILVESGRVLVQRKASNEKITLSQGEFAISSHKQLSRKNLEDSNYLAWKTRIFEFTNESLKEVFRLVEDIYQVKITVMDETIYDLRLTSSYYKQTAEAILNTISTAFDLKITLEDDTYIVSYNP